jgi:hypothetical protein
MILGGGQTAVVSTVSGVLAGSISCNRCKIIVEHYHIFS